MFTSFAKLNRLGGMALVCLTAVMGAAPAVAQTLPSGVYEFMGDINDPSTRAPISGTFTLLGGEVAELTVTFDDSIIITTAGASYSGTDIPAVNGGLLSGTLALTNPGPSNTGSGYLTLNSDGTFVCGGSTTSTGSDYCQLSQNVYGTDENEKTGTYSVNLVTPIAEPEPATDQEVLASFMQNRGSRLIAAQPGLIGLLSGASSGRVNVDATRGGGTFDLSTAAGEPVWAGVQGDWSETGDAKNSFVLGVVGAHYAVTPDFLLGLMAEIDRFEQEDGDITTEGDGYLVGPYVVAKAPTQPLYVEGRYLIGATENSVTVGDADAQDFETDRTLASLKVAGDVKLGALTLTPSLSASHLEDIQPAFTDNTDAEVPEQSVVLQDVALGLDFAKPFDMANGEMTLRGGISGIWSEVSGIGVAEGLTAGFDGERARVHLGTTYTTDSGMTLHASVSYDGIGTDDFESLGLALGLDMKF